MHLIFFEHKILTAEASLRKALEPLHRGVDVVHASEIILGLEIELARARGVTDAGSIVKICDEYLRAEARATSLNDILVYFLNKHPTELGETCSACLAHTTYDSVACGASRGNTSVVEIPGRCERFEIGSGEFYEEWTGCRVWPGAVHMSGILLEGRFKVLNADVLELGSGVGLTGIACIKSGARSLAFTEYQASLLEVCEENVKRNSAEGKTSSFVLDWSDFDSKTHEGFLSWRSNLSEDFLVVGSELVYDEIHAKLVLGVLTELFRAGARAALIVVMVNPSRSGVELFLHLLANLEEASPFTCRVEEEQYEDGKKAACIYLDRK